MQTTEFDKDNSSTNKGLLFLIGGAEDKKNEQIVLRKILQLSKAKNIVLITSASLYPNEVFTNYAEAFQKIGVENVHNFDIRYPHLADDNKYFDILKTTDLIYFSGGDQVKLVKALKGSQLLEMIKNKHFTENLHIAASSGGASAASNPMIYDGDYEGFNKDSVNFSAGFGFINNLTIDTHFFTRGRLPRIVQFLMTGRSFRGLGLDEDTAVVISPDNNIEVFGNGMVTMISTNENIFTNYENVESGNFFSAENIQLAFLAPNTKFSLNNWKIIV